MFFRLIIVALIHGITATECPPDKKCLIGTFTCQTSLPVGEMSELQVTLYHVKSLEEYETVGDKIDAKIGEEFFLITDKKKLEGRILLSIDVNYCAESFRSVDYDIAKAHQNSENVTRLGEIPMENLLLDEYPVNLYE